ncbi:MAG: hypothetical protein A2Y65_09665 [Deltaproteobacteria bacterium RBG_13_52_11]|nr:MAG: hypothetical protein A2Y65_09665 [Deltaproteobacteria bacterium RBG_13_52_11]
MKPKTIVVLVLIGLFLIILVQNAQVVTLRLLFWEIGMSQIILLPLAMFIGFILGFIVAQMTSGSHSKKEGK